MTCVGRAPNSIDEWTAIIERCATAAGGANWQTLALTGLLTLALLGLAVLLLVGFVRAAR